MKREPILDLDRVVLSATQFQFDPRILRGDSLWSPVDSQIQRALSGVPYFLDTCSRNFQPSGNMTNGCKEILGKLSEYKVQGIGLFRNGQRIVHLNFFVPGTLAPDWRTAYVSVLDGGSDYWRIDFSLESGEYLNFSVNGVG
jgi:hypothetical protein